MSEHTASTRHIIDLAVTVPGDEGPDTDYLESIISTALMQAGFQPLFVAASEDVGLGGEEAAVVLNDDETYTNLDGCSIRLLPPDAHLHQDANEFDMLLEF